MSLSGRLSKLSSYYSNQHSIWDIGCDHGLLGLSFHKMESVKSIHLVDPSDRVIEALKLKLKDSDIPHVTIHHEPGQNIKLDRESKCIFIAGMGGKEIAEILKHFESQMGVDDQVVISPHRSVLLLRDYLFQSSFRLVTEEAFFEDGQFYPILVLSKIESLPRVTLYGENLWKGETGTAYKKHQIKFFETHQDPSSQAYLAYLKGFKP